MTISMPLYIVCFLSVLYLMIKDSSRDLYWPLLVWVTSQMLKWIVVFASDFIYIPNFPQIINNWAAGNDILAGLMIALITISVTKINGFNYEKDIANNLIETLEAETIDHRGYGTGYLEIKSALPGSTITIEGTGIYSDQPKIILEVT